MEGLIAKLPDWAGTVPQWFLLAGVVIAFIKIWPTIRQQNFDFTAAAKKAYDVRVSGLEHQLSECERKCDEREEFFKKEIDGLKTKINNEEWQRTQSEISLVRTLIDIVPAPQLKIILEALQRRGASLPGAVTAIGGPVDDSKGNGK